jgi:hypothetical protein
MAFRAAWLLVMLAQNDERGTYDDVLEDFSQRDTFRPEINSAPLNIHAWHLPARKGKYVDRLLAEQ